MKEYMFLFEDKAKEKGYQLIAGMDEAGRGPLAGPVFTAMVIMPLNSESIINGINDSKQLSPQKREKLYDEILSTALAYAICPVDENTIDKMNILEATKYGMQKCLQSISIRPDYCLVDYVSKLKLDIPFETIVKGDAKSYNIACASILAKVARDRYMLNVAKEYPEYCFDKHKGYGTKLHYEMIKKYGVSAVHRKSFLKNLEEHIGTNKE